MGLLSAFRRLRVRIAGGRKRSAESDPEENGACHHRRAYAVPDQENTAERSSDATKESVAHALWNPGGHKISGSAEPLSLGTTRVLEINTTLSCRADARAPSEPSHTAPCPRSHPVCSIHPSASQSGDHSCESPCCPQAPRVSPLTPGLVRGLPSRLETRDPQELSLEDQASCSTSTEMVPTKLDCDLKRARPRTLHKARSSPAIPYKAPMEEIPPCPTWTEITPVNGDCV
ncbi:hypothetical protein BOTBODRAFT_401829 [Botryobasidium botryosum FD-172 SS1]|uniref:Uncharacterized protein n=1 Tax=Botryobasidium botryosum (strain FD-172 SS1) TaxID=930990 RepID=A0A067MBW3_BOTB1|nr:hypothetical protein BOTBODRAFT_401829 [Botryobasidium botryosum FD-172 SS1]